MSDAILTTKTSYLWLSLPRVLLAYCQQIATGMVPVLNISEILLPRMEHQIFSHCVPQGKQVLQNPLDTLQTLRLQVLPLSTCSNQNQ